MVSFGTLICLFFFKKSKGVFLFHWFFQTIIFIFFSFPFQNKPKHSKKSKKPRNKWKLPKTKSLFGMLLPRQLKVSILKKDDGLFYLLSVFSRPNFIIFYHVLLFPYFFLFFFGVFFILSHHFSRFFYFFLFKYWKDSLMLQIGWLMQVLLMKAWNITPHQKIMWFGSEIPILSLISCCLTLDHGWRINTLNIQCLWEHFVGLSGVGSVI